jgi:DNA-binding PadR family transcriptional regulator
MNSPLGSNKELVENKLMLLYLIDKLNLPVSNLQIIKLILGNKLMNYFQLQQNLTELKGAGYLSTTNDGGRTIFSITESGSQVLTLLSDHLHPGIMERIDLLIASVRNNIKNEILITADYYAERENEYIASCKMSEENFTLISIELLAGSKNDAKTICENWKKHSQDIYAEIIETLTKKR